MAIKRKADGTIEWTPEQEEDIEIATEARVRANKRIKAAEKKDKQDADCSAGNHAAVVNGKCENCGKEVTAPAPQPESRRRLRL